MLSWDDFRYVKAIAERRSLGGAAEVLNVNHSTVFRRLGQIERQLGSRLFERGRAGYALTPSGEDMVRLAERVSEDIVAFERKVTGQDLRPSGELRVTCADTVLLHLLTNVFAGFRRAYPDIAVEVLISNSMFNLSKRDADVAVRATYQPPDALSGHRAARVAWSVYGPQSKKASPFDPRMHVPQYDWVAFSDHNAVGRATRWLRERGGEERIVYKVNSMLGLAEAVSGGIGLALLPCFVGETVPGLVRLCPPISEIEGELWLLTHPDLHKTVRVRAFLDFCTAALAKQRKLLAGSAVV